MASYIFVTGGVISALGKGIVVASIGRMLKSRQVSVVPLKLDPYLNVDPGTMSPYQHGEVFVTVDGRETDLDLGHYERFIDVELSSKSNITAGQIYRELIRKERDGEFLGGTIQTVPHVTNAIRHHIKELANETKADVVVVEVGGTVGDIECQPFLEALRQLRDDPAVEKCFYVHLTLMPSLGNGELKTKPTQHSVQVLRSMGIQPDMVICRADQPVSASAREKISVHCNVPDSNVIGLPTLDNVYQVPIYLEQKGIGDIIAKRLGIRRKAHNSAWRKAVSYRNNLKEVKIAIVGKYVELPDAYLSVIEALNHAAHANRRKLTIKWVMASELSVPVERYIGDVNGILVPGGFDTRGIDGMIMAANYARERGVPYFGICLGLHVMIIEYARNVLGLNDADSVEFNPDTPHPVIDLMPEQSGLQQTGGTMRLGSWECHLKEGTRLRQIYGNPVVFERHRHRYEVNNQFSQTMQNNGLVASGYTANGKLVETCELSNHKFMVGCQFHPEFASRPDRPHPLFYEFVKSCIHTSRKADFNIQQQKPQIAFTTEAESTLK